MASTPSPALSAPAVLAQLAGAVVGGLVGAVLLYFLTFLLFQGAGLGMGLLSLQFFGAVLGFAVGAGVGVGVAGRMLGQAGSSWLAVVCALAGGAAVILVMRLLNLGGLFGILGVGILVALAGAVVGYNLRRR